MTRPSRVLELVGARERRGCAGRRTLRPRSHPACPGRHRGRRRVTSLAHAGLVSGDISAPRPTTPWMGDQAVPTGRNRSSPSGRSPDNAAAPDAAPRAVHRRTDPTSSPTASPPPRPTLGDRLFILGHHYQRDEVMRWADARGDSFRLSRLAADNHEAEFIVFCGVHFMAESADILTADHQQVILPDLNAGCSMADMADIDEVEEAWEALAGVTDIDRVVPDHLHELLGRPQGVRRPPRRRGVHVDQRPGRPRVGPRAGRQGAVLPRPAPRPQHRPASWATTDDDMRVWNPRLDLGGLDRGRRARRPPSCSGRATARCTSASGPSTSRPFRAEHPDGIVVVHPECAHEVVRARRPGRLHRLHHQGGRGRARRARPSPSAPRSTSCSGWPPSTPTRRSSRSTRSICPCSTMFRIDAAHLCWVLENLVDGKVVNRITVDADTSRVGQGGPRADARHHLTPRRAAGRTLTPWTSTARPSCSPAAPARSATPSSRGSPSRGPTRSIRVFSRDELKQSEMRARFGDDQLRYLIGDVRDRRRMTRAAQGADIIVHAAAMKQVPACEYNPFEAVRTNVLGAQHVVDAAIDAGVPQGRRPVDRQGRQPGQPLRRHQAVRREDRRAGQRLRRPVRDPAVLRPLRQRRRLARLGRPALPAADGRGPAHDHRRAHDPVLDHARPGRRPRALRARAHGRRRGLHPEDPVDAGGRPGRGDGARPARARSSASGPARSSTRCCSPRREPPRRSTPATSTSSCPSTRGGTSTRAGSTASPLDDGFVVLQRHQRLVARRRTSSARSCRDPLRPPVDRRRRHRRRRRGAARATGSPRARTSSEFEEALAATDRRPARGRVRQRHRRPARRRGGRRARARATSSPRRRCRSSASANCARYVGATPALRRHRPGDAQPRPGRRPGRTSTPRRRALRRPAGRPRRAPPPARGSSSRTPPTPSAPRTPDGPVGNCARSDMCCFSFHPVKADHHRRGRRGHDQLRRAGRRAPALPAATASCASPSAGGWYYEIDELGFNYRLTDIQAALGTSQLGQARPVRRPPQRAGRPLPRAARPACPSSCRPRRPPARATPTTCSRSGSPTAAACYDALRAGRRSACRCTTCPIYRHPLYADLGVGPADFPDTEAAYERAALAPAVPRPHRGGAGPWSSTGCLSCRVPCDATCADAPSATGRVGDGPPLLRHRRGRAPTTTATSTSRAG